MERVFVTGASGYIAGKLLSLLNDKAEIKEIVGIDIKEPAISLKKFVFYKLDVREQFEHILKDHRIDTVVHTAYIVPPIHDVNLMEDINVNGTRNVLHSCTRADVNQLLYTSSATAYGFHPDNDVPLTEESPLRGNDDFTYSKNKKEIENILSEFILHNPQLIVTIVRPSFVVGPGFDDPLARHLRKKFVLLPLNTQPFQFVHEDDLIDIIYLLLKKRMAGAFNVGAEGTVTLKQMVSLLRNMPVYVPFRLMYLLTWLAWNLRLSFVTEFPGPALSMTRYHWVVSSEKLKRALNYKYKYTSLEAFMDFAEFAKRR
jgi:UDP-glucose 4-epimerase